MANTVFMSKTGLIGGEATKLDSIDGAGLVDGDAAFVNVSNVQYIYRLDADSGAAESSPNIIAPDTNPGDKRWILQNVPDVMLSGAIMGDTTSKRVIRVSELRLMDGTDANHLKVSFTNIWNGYSAATQDNIGKDNVETGIYTLNGTGNLLRINTSGFAGVALIILSAEIVINYCAAGLSCSLNVNNPDILVSLFANPAAGAALDLTAVADDGQVNIRFTYLTVA